MIKVNIQVIRLLTILKAYILFPLCATCLYSSLLLVSFSKELEIVLILQPIFCVFEMRQ